jgi:gluconate 2-dehydrogenase gamma chain
MNRRDILKGALAGAGVTAAQGQHTGHAAAAPAKAPAWKALLFDAHQVETVVTLSDLIIPATDTPGAKAARVVEYIDVLLNDGPAERRNAFLSGLGWLDGYAIRTHGKPFVRCTEAQQIAALKSIDGAREGEMAPGGEFFAQMKALTVSGYYTSKIGIDELNKGGRVPGTYGCRDKGKHA